MLSSYNTNSKQKKYSNKLLLPAKTNSIREKKMKETTFFAFFDRSSIQNISPVHSCCGAIHTRHTAYRKHLYNVGTYFGIVFCIDDTLTWVGICSYTTITFFLSFIERRIDACRRNHKFRNLHKLLFRLDELMIASFSIQF